MKVVLFCGGLGMRMRADSQSLPKPMTPIGSRPVLWHVMRYYAHFGHKDFILCLGYGAQAVKDYFLNYRETTSNDFVLRQGGDDVKMLSTDISEWTISFIDTGIDTAIGERLRRVRPYLDGDEIFLANYGDVLTDAPMNDLIKQFAKTDAVAQLLAVKPQDSFHVVDIEGDSTVTGLTAVAEHVHANQRRLLRLPERDLRLPQSGRGSRHGCLHAGRQGWPASRGTIRRLLGSDGHAQGAQRAGGAIPPGEQPMGTLAGTAGRSGTPGDPGPRDRPGPPVTGSPGLSRTANASSIGP